MNPQSLHANRSVEPEGPAHAHEFRIRTAPALGHTHHMLLYTYAVNGTGEDGHIHKFQGHTLMADGSHFHRVTGQTGPAIPLPGGKHYHEASGELDDEPFQPKGGYYTTMLSVPRHVHGYAGRSGPPIGTEPPEW
ncbi:hypothetical protein J2T17_000543 [Paenibacillus mucilaginosus]|uniref:YmaF family protein n=1 Tax=Paenibacillus mucilaginosus TaxID=61624 RepID=UPI003D1A68DE